MDGHRYALWLAVVVGLFCFTGTTCPRRLMPIQTPQVLPPTPTVAQIVEAVNQRSRQIQSFSTNSATLSGSGWPSLRANIAFERPRMFRLVAETGITGAEVDLGSNSDMFWFWVKRSQPPAIFFCRHDQYATGQARQRVPIDPNWLIEALGVAEFDPSLPHEGPYADPSGRLQIRTIRNTPEGPMTKVTLVDPSSAWIMEQRIYNAQNQLVASSVAEGYRRDPLSNIYMPTAVRIDFPAAGMSLRVSLGNVQVNRPVGNPERLWAMPSYPGAQPVDLCDPNLQLAPVGVPPATAARMPTVDPRQPATWR